jgi:hypothetical protein
VTRFVVQDSASKVDYEKFNVAVEAYNALLLKAYSKQIMEGA